VTEAVDRLEDAAYRAWPPQETEVYDGWTLRFSEGFSRRVNSVDARGPSSLDLITKVEECSDRYSARGLPLLFRITPTTEPAVDALLGDLGFTEEGVTQVRTRPVSGDRPWVNGLVEPTPCESWIEHQLRFAGVDRALVDPWLRMLDRLPVPAGFATVEAERGEIAAVGFGVVVDGYLGVFEVITAPQKRRRGSATALMATLDAWGARLGARHAFLQVMVDSHAATMLYDRLGFTEAYRYHYRRGPIDGIRGEHKPVRRVEQS
jgi:ribosomal protein S18 acetylase RimI-like enzyme